MAPTIDPSDLGTNHLERIVQVSWPMSASGTGFRGSVRGTLTNISHDLSGTSITVAYAPGYETSIALGSNGAEIELVGDFDPPLR